MFFFITDGSYDVSKNTKKAVTEQLVQSRGNDHVHTVIAWHRTRMNITRCSFHVLYKDVFLCRKARQRSSLQKLVWLIQVSSCAFSVNILSFISVLIVQTQLYNLSYQVNVIKETHSVWNLQMNVYIRHIVLTQLLWRDNAFHNPPSVRLPGACGSLLCCCGKYRYHSRFYKCVTSTGFLFPQKTFILRNVRIHCPKFYSSDKHSDHVHDLPLNLYI